VCIKHGHNIASASASATESFPAPHSSLGYGIPPPRSQRNPNFDWKGLDCVVSLLSASSNLNQEYLAAPLCVNKTYTYNAASLSDDLPARRPFVTFHLRKPSNILHKPSIKALYDTGAAVSLFTPDNFALIKKYGIVRGEIEEKCKKQNASQQPMKIFGTWRVSLFLYGRPMPAAFIVSPNVAHSIVGINIIAPRRFVPDPVTCKIDFREESSAAAVAQMPRDYCGNIADVRVAKRIMLKAHHGHLVKLGLYDQDGHRIRRSIETIVDIDPVAHAVRTNSCGSYYAHMPNTSNEDRVVPCGTLVRKVKDLNEWLPLDAASATEITKPGVPMRLYTSAEREQIISCIKESINRTVLYQYRDDYARMLIAREHFFSADNNSIGSTDLLEHQIDLKTNDPIYCPQFRLTAEHLKHIQENVAGWLQCGIIERSLSPTTTHPSSASPRRTARGSEQFGTIAC
jgi:hypothetical protein